MKATLIFCCILSISFGRLSAQNCTLLTETTQKFGKDSLAYLESANKIIQTQDGNFLMAGSWNEKQGFLRKTKLAGDSLWQKTYRFGSMTVFNDLLEDESGNLVIIGTCTDCSPDSVSKILVLQIDANGVIISDTTYGALNKAATGQNIAATEDGGFVLTGFTQRGGFAGNSVHLYKFSANILYEWHQFYEKLYFDYGLSTIQTSDLGYAITGRGFNFGEVTYITYFKTDSLGSLIWSQKMVLDPEKKGVENKGTSVKQLPNDHLLITGTVYLDSSKGNQLFLAEVDIITGDTLRFQTFGNEYGDFGEDLHLLENGNIAIAGSQGRWASFNYAWILIVDSTFQEVTSYTYSLGLYNEALSMLPLSSDGSAFVFCGRRRYINVGMDAIYVSRYSPPRRARLDQFPLHKQLYARRLTNSTATVPISGSIDDSTETYQEMRLKVLRNDSTFLLIQAYPLSYTEGLASFSFSPQITVELNNFGFELYGFDGQKEYLEASAYEVVAGDVYLIQGQSNAVASASISGEVTNEINQSPFVRVFGSAGVNYEEKWFIGKGDVDPQTNGNTGQWGLRLASTIVEAQGVPLAIFNGAVSGSHLRQHLPDSTDRYAPASIYGRMLTRLEQAQLKENIRAIIFFQGETDGWFAAKDTSIQYTTRYKTDFLKLYEAWQEDFIFEKTYFFQTRMGCLIGEMWGGVTLQQNTIGNLQIMEAQRQIAEELPQIGIMSTTAVLHNGCHYPYTGGYEVLADRIYRLIARDLYASSDTLNIEPPAIKSAEYREDGNIVCTFQNPHDALLWQEGAEKDFILKGVQDSVLTGRIEGQQLILTLSANVAPNAISYAGHILSDTPFVTNTRGVGMLAFHKFPIINTVNTTPSKKKLHVSLFPNPITNGLAHLYVENTSYRNIQLKMFNTLGQLVLSKTFPLSMETQTYKISLSQSPGLYYIHLTADRSISKVLKVVLE